MTRLIISEIGIWSWSMHRWHARIRRIAALKLRLRCKRGFNLFRYRRSRSYAMGFGVGIAMGPAAVGTIGYEGRIDYTAIGNVLNLASRLCCGADDTQMLVDAIVAKQVKQ